MQPTTAQQQMPVLEYPSLQAEMAMFEERLSDPNDQGTRQELIHNTESLRKARMAMAPQYHPDFDGEHCVDCGSDIPEGRLAMSRIRCVPCETVVERLGKTRKPHRN